MSNLKKVVALAMALALVLTMFASASIKTNLPVVDADKFTEAQQEAAALLMPLGVLTGIGAEELGAGTVTRAQMVAFIYRLINGGDAGKDAYYSKTALYTDVAPDYWGAPYINWAYAAKVAFGYGETFGPEDPVTGAQAAAMLVRLLGKDASGNDYALKAESNAIALQLDKGIETKGLYENALSRGDMFILLANTLLTEYKDGNVITTIAQKYFDLQIINGAILLANDKIGSNKYTVFSFRESTSGDIKYFVTDLLCIEGEGADFDSIGCKYTLLVSAHQIDRGFSLPNNQGYRWLYAAYEEPENGYYKILSGTVDDGKLDFDKLKFDDMCFFYINGEKADLKSFKESYGIPNGAKYKLIDNDGDGKYEFALIQRLTLSDIGTKTVTAKVTAVNAGKSAITLTTADGETLTVKFGKYWDSKCQKVLDKIDAIKYALGIGQDGYAPYTAISEVYYDFVIAGNYLFDIKISEKTSFSGSYGILATWSTPMTMYKNMPYACFVNEQSEYFWAYVDKIDDAPAAGMVPFTWNNSLIYFTDGDFSDDVVSFYTANFWNSNYTYNDLLSSLDFQASAGAYTVSFPCAYYTGVNEKITDYSKIAELFRTGLAGVYAVFKSNPNGKSYWEQTTQSYVTIGGAFLVDSSYNRQLNGIDLLKYQEVEGKWVLQVTTPEEFYGLTRVLGTKAADGEGFIYLIKELKLNVKVSIDTGAGFIFSEKQIYKRNGFWHVRFFNTTTPAITAADLSNFSIEILDDPYLAPGYYGIFKDDASGNWFFKPKADHKDPGTGYTIADSVRVKDVIRGFDDANFENYLLAKLPGGITDARDYTLLNDGLGVIFAYGSVVDNNVAVRTIDWTLPSVTGFFNFTVPADAIAYRWVAYDAKTFDSDFGYGAQVYQSNLTGNIYANDGLLPTGTNTADELIFTKVGSTYYVKALKVSDWGASHLPYGWISANDYELVIFDKLTGAVNTKGWEVKLVTFDKDGLHAVSVYTMLGTGFASTGDVMLVKRDANGDLVEIYAVGTNVWDYLTVNTRYSAVARGAYLTSKNVVEGDDNLHNYFKSTLQDTIWYVWYDARGNFCFSNDFASTPGKTSDEAAAGMVPVVDVDRYNAYGITIVAFTGNWVWNSQVHPYKA